MRKTFPLKFASLLLISLMVVGELGRPVNCGTLEDLVTLDRLLKENYDRRATPTNHLNKSTPTRVYCELFVRSFGSPSPLTMDYKVDLYLRQQWVDERLRHKDITRTLDLNDPNLVKAIWKPEVYFPNSKDADFQFVTVPNVLVRIHPDGKILYMLRLKITFSCMMDLSKISIAVEMALPFPFINCMYLRGVYFSNTFVSKTVEELILDWKLENPITTATTAMTQFDLVDIVAAKCHEAFQIGNYSCLVAEFHLARLLGFHLVQSYLPTILMVVISWVSFWMDVNSVPGRVTLGITTLLTVSSKATNVQENIESSYVKAIDIWMGTCTAFVFLALMEFTVVNYLWRKECLTHFTQRALLVSPSTSRNAILSSSSTAPNPLPPDKNEASVVGGEAVKVLQSSPTTAGVEKAEGNDWEARFVEAPNHQLQYQYATSRTKDKYKTNLERKLEADGGKNRNQDLAKRIDESCRIFFPLSFTLFVISYWLFYLYL